MKSLQLSSSIETAPMVQQERGKILREHGIRTIEDLLWHLPFRYEDWTDLTMIGSLRPDRTATVCGEVIRTHLQTTSRRNFRILDVSVRDASGMLILRFFNQPYLKDQFEKGKQVIAHGTPRREPFAATAVMENPLYEFVRSGEDPAAHLQIKPVYERIGSMTPKMLRWIIKKCLDLIPGEAFGEPIPEDVRRRYKLIGRKAAFQSLHFPEGAGNIEKLMERRSQGHRRLIFEEFFLLEVGLAYRHRERPQKTRKLIIDDEIRAKIRRVIPFRLTDAQKRVVREIVEDMKRPAVMYRLLQGDVGSGKTIAALLSALVAICNGYQVAFMVPTEILAEQHFANLRYLLRNTTYVIRLLVSGQPKKQRGEYLEEIRSGACHLVVGTHALIQSTVEFHSLAMAIIDEQHRFGVLQREALIRKGAHPDCLIMTATPIPRSLALTAYGDLDTSVLDEMPPGRKPVLTKTWPLKKKAELYSRIEKEVARGKQAYVLCPLIEESEKLQLTAAEKLTAELRRAFPKLTIGLIHGSIPAREREVIMADFLARKMHLLVATTVIEVGIDVPNASIMVIEHAERFGLSQLHQLRGRVGRGSDQSYCFLLIPDPSKMTEEASGRIEAMVSTTDGFKIAEKDLQIRGPGELTGTRQSGVPTFRIGNLVLDQKILEVAREEAFKYLESQKSSPDALRNFFQRYWNRRFGLIQIG